MAKLTSFFLVVAAMSSVVNTAPTSFQNNVNGTEVNVDIENALKGEFSRRNNIVHLLTLQTSNFLSSPEMVTLPSTLQSRMRQPDRPCKLGRSPRRPDHHHRRLPDPLQ